MATRMWRVHKQAGRSFPAVSDDEVVDYLVMEAVGMKIAGEDNKAREDAQRAEWKKRTNDLRQRVGT